MKINFLPDSYEENEQVLSKNFLNFVDQIKNCLHRTTTPFVYGILGDWGSGKTTALKLLEKKVQHDFDQRSQLFIPVWFNVWQYENQVDIVYPLLHAIKKDYEQRVSTIKNSQITKKFVDSFKKTVETSVVGLTDFGLKTMTKVITGEAIGLKEIKDYSSTLKETQSSLEKILNEWVDKVDQIKKAFEELLDTYAEDLSKDSTIIKEDIRFVIIIDDLDRCLPQTVITLLENIKNYLSVKNCIFVLGLNPKVVYQGIRIKYNGLEIDGREYLEKILNYPFYIPEPEEDEIKQFIHNQINLCLENAEQFRTDNRTKDFLEEFDKVLSKCYLNNLRRIKRILNRYLIFIGQLDLNDHVAADISRLVILSETFPDIFKLFLGEKEKVNQIRIALSKVGTANFNTKLFDDNGVSLTFIYPQMVMMKELFQFSSNSLEKFIKSVEVVFRFTRLV